MPVLARPTTRPQCRGTYSALCSAPPKQATGTCYPGTSLAAWRRSAARSTRCAGVAGRVCACKQKEGLRDGCQSSTRRSTSISSNLLNSAKRLLKPMVRAAGCPVRLIFTPHQEGTQGGGGAAAQQAAAACEARRKPAPPQPPLPQTCAASQHESLISPKHGRSALAFAAPVDAARVLERSHSGVAQLRAAAGGRRCCCCAASGWQPPQICETRTKCCVVDDIHHCIRSPVYSSRDQHSTTLPNNRTTWPLPAQAGRF